MGDLRAPGIPRVQQVRSWVFQGVGVWVDRGLRWQVEYPDPWKACGYECCGVTEFRTFDTWREAVQFAVRQEWKRQ